MTDVGGEVTRRIQVLVGVVGVLGAIACACGFLPGLVAVDRAGARTVELAGGEHLALFLVAMGLPGIAVFRSPRWIPIVTWIGWTAACSTLLFGRYLGWAREIGIDLAASKPLWPLAIVACCLAAMAVLVAIAIPCVREQHHARGPEFPSAQVRS